MGKNLSEKERDEIIENVGAYISDNSSRISESFDILSNVVHCNAVAKGFWDDERNDGECIALIHSEISEALEGLRKDKMDEHCPDLKSVEVELADAIIRILDFAGARNLQLGKAIIEKMLYNITRPYKHGKKF